jgi:hypothetical protein
MSITCNQYTSLKPEGVQVDHGLEGQEKSQQQQTSSRPNGWGGRS